MLIENYSSKWKSNRKKDEKNLINIIIRKNIDYKPFTLDEFSKNYLKQIFLFNECYRKHRALKKAEIKRKNSTVLLLFFSKCSIND